MPNEHVSLEVAQRLQKLGWKGDTDRYWVNHGTNQWELLSSISIPLYIPEKDTNLVIPAPSAGKLAEELPNKSYFGHLMITRLVRSSGTNIPEWRVQYSQWDKEKLTLEFYQDAINLPDALGLMMCYLLENGLIAK